MMALTVPILTERTLTRRQYDGIFCMNGTQTGQEMRNVQLQSHTCLTTPTTCTIFIHYIHLLYFSSMFRCHLRHHRGELLRHLPNTTSYYESIIYSQYSCPVIYKGHNFVCGPGLRIRAGRSGDRIRMDSRFSVPVQTRPWGRPIQLVLSLSSG